MKNIIKGKCSIIIRTKNEERWISSCLSEVFNQKYNKIEVIILSLVQYITGYKIDFKFLNELKIKFPDLIIIGDASQYCGTDFFNLERLISDVLLKCLFSIAEFIILSESTASSYIFEAVIELFNTF